MQADEEIRAARLVRLRVLPDRRPLEARVVAQPGRGPARGREDLGGRVDSDEVEAEALEAGPGHERQAQVGLSAAGIHDPYALAPGPDRQRAKQLEVVLHLAVLRGLRLAQPSLRA